jgi:hypothetical protein
VGDERRQAFGRSPVQNTVTVSSFGPKARAE